VELNSTAACTLGVLDIGPPPPDRVRWEEDQTMSGADVWLTITRSLSGFWSMTRSQVYQELKRLTDRRFIETTNEGRYRLTSAGRDAVQSWFHGFALAEPKDDQMRSAVTLTIFFGHYLDPALLTRVVREHRLRLERRLDTLRRIEHALDQDRSLPGSTLQRGIAQLEVGIAWTDDVIDRISTRPARRNRRKPTNK